MTIPNAGSAAATRNRQNTAARKKILVFLLSIRMARYFSYTGRKALILAKPCVNLAVKPILLSVACARNFALIRSSLFASRYNNRRFSQSNFFPWRSYQKINQPTAITIKQARILAISPPPASNTIAVEKSRAR